VKVLITGGSGFLGKIIRYELKKEFSVVELSRTTKTGIPCDLSGQIPELPGFDYIVHAAGKVHVEPKNAVEANEFYQINYQGTVNLTKGLEMAGLPKSFVFISTVSVYGLEQGKNIDEDYPLKGTSPYAQSKIKAEEFLIDWGQKHDVKVAILRLPLIVGPNPPGNLGAIKKAIAKGYYFRIGEGSTKKSMVWAADIAQIIPKCFESSGIYNLTDDRDPSIRELDTAIASKSYKKIRVLPLSVVKVIALPSKFLSAWPIDNSRINKLTTSLTFSSEKAVKELRWEPRSVIDCIDEYGI